MSQNDETRLEFDRETKDAWDTLLQAICAVMLEAATATGSPAR